MQKQNITTIQFGTHLMIDGYNADPEILKDKSILKKLLEELPKKMGMHTINDPVVIEVGPKNKKDPGGLSGFVMIAESHISFHTFPARGFVTIDVYTCQDEIETEKFLREFKDVFSFKTEDIHYIPRGLNYPSQNIDTS